MSNDIYLFSFAVLAVAIVALYPRIRETAIRTAVSLYDQFYYYPRVTKIHGTAKETAARLRKMEADMEVAEAPYIEQEKSISKLIRTAKGKHKSDLNLRLQGAKLERLKAREFVRQRFLEDDAKRKADVEALGIKRAELFKKFIKV